MRSTSWYTVLFTEQPRRQIFYLWYSSPHHEFEWVLCTRFWLWCRANLSIRKCPIVLQLNSGFVGTHYIVERTVQVVLRPLHPVFFVGFLHQLTVQAAVEGLPQCLPGSLDCACRGLETALAQHFYELGHCSFVILLHPLFYGIQHFSGELKRPTTLCVCVQVDCTEDTNCKEGRNSPPWEVRTELSSSCW